ncbi:S41 family peptidase [Longimicrobium sp.]|uniref:S41 family peptidase n=1 Tax=Longimicrobium sp. TaxID=2029185 RepID=UPI002B7CE2B5|nr:S41 family peptidase [Longimicrobium sp.]HSU16216.1 S41 family peptidase [Longimicrobium sp.]
MTNRISRITLAAVALAAAALPANAQSPRGGAARGTPITPQLAAETFDTAWSVIDRSLWDTAVVNGPWKQARADLRPRALAATTVQQLRGVLAEMIGRLSYSHFEVIPGEVQQRLAESQSSGTGDAGMEVRLVDGRLLVTRVDSGGPAAEAGVRTGWALDAVGAKTAREMLSLLERIPGAREPRGRQLYAWMSAAGALRGQPGSRVRVRFLDGNNRTVTRELTLREPRGVQMVKFGNLPPLAVSWGSRRLQGPEGTTAGLIRFSYWMPPVVERLNAAMDSLRDADGIVVDLRGNLGGVGAMAPGFAGHFLDRVDTLGIMRTRTGTLYLVSYPRTVDTQARPVRPFAGPVAVLTDAMSASTSEFFAGGLQQLGRVRVFGEPTAAQALPAYAQKLPDGDVLMHAVADFTGKTGKRFEGLGVTPDVAAPPTRDALLAGRDPALEAALAWIAEVKRGRAPAR